MYRTLQNPISQVPGPWISRWTDLKLIYYWLTGRRAYYVHALHEQYGISAFTYLSAFLFRARGGANSRVPLGPIVRLSPDEVDVTDLAAVKEIHSIKGGFGKSDWYGRLISAGVTNVFSTNDIEFHRRHRRLLQQPLSESALKTVEPYVRDKAELAIRRIGSEMESRGAVDVFKWSLFFSTDVIGELTFGESFRMLDIGKVRVLPPHTPFSVV